MLLYVFLFFMVAIGAFLDITNSTGKNKKVFATVLGMACIVLSGIRWETGTDWVVYFDFFNSNDTFEQFSSDNFEIGYATFNYLIKLMTDHYNVFLFIMAFIIIGLKYRTVFLYSIFPLASICLNFSNYNGDLFPVRQIIAVALTMWSIDFIIKRKIYLFFLIVALASTFHITALLFLPAYYIFHMNISREKLFICTIISMLIGLSNVIQVFAEFLVGYFGGNEYLLIFKMADYLSAQEAGENFGAAISSGGAILLGIVRRSVFLPFLIYYKDYFMKKNDIYSGFLNLTLVGFWFYFSFSSLSTSIAGRGSIYYNIYEIIIMPYLFLLVKGSSGKLYLFIAFIIFCAMKYYYGLYGYYDLFIPFITIFDNTAR